MLIICEKFLKFGEYSYIVGVDLFLKSEVFKAWVGKQMTLNKKILNQLYLFNIKIAF